MAQNNKKTGTPLSPEARGTLKILFLTLFLDLMGFSIIFPLFPSLAKYYLTVDGDNAILNAIFNGMSTFASTTGGGDKLAGIVLFGGALGAIYSLLQFISAPIWGSLSDRYGRKPILLISTGCTALSYALWFFSGSFTLLIISRVISGFMGGNISTATASAADVTSEENRSKGMAIIGMAFGFGFIFGPCIGALSTFWDMSTIESLVPLGVNPFSAAALFAFLLSTFSFFLIAKNFKETLPESKRGASSGFRTANPIKLFTPLPYKGVNLTNFGHFFFLAIFSGMEFTLTFLAYDRLNFTSRDNGWLFFYVGMIIALVQGGLVRRKAAAIGEKKMSIMGLICLIPGLVLLAIASSKLIFFAGLTFLAFGSAMIIPCLTALVSLYSPKEQQGRAIGTFRSLGALARVIGPFLASIGYFTFGAASTYYLGAVSIILPLLIIFTLPKRS